MADRGRGAPAPRRRGRPSRSRRTCRGSASPSASGSATRRLFLVTRRARRGRRARARGRSSSRTRWSSAPRSSTRRRPREERTDTVVVFRRPGVMDPAEASIRRGAARLGYPLDAVRTGTAYVFQGRTDEVLLRRIAVALLSNPAIEEARGRRSSAFPPAGPLPRKAVPARNPAPRRRRRAARADQPQGRPLASASLEMRAIRDHFREARPRADGPRARDDRADLDRALQAQDASPARSAFEGDASIDNLLSRRSSTRRERARHGRGASRSSRTTPASSRSTTRTRVCIKVETHNHPSAIEPYGGAGTGVGGVIRDILGMRPRRAADREHRRVLRRAARPRRRARAARARCTRGASCSGVVAGVRDYGNRMGIPTVERRDRLRRALRRQPARLLRHRRHHPAVGVDKAVAARRPRSSRSAAAPAATASTARRSRRPSCTEESETIVSGAVQIGNAITEKKVLDVVLQARDRGPLPRDHRLRRRRLLVGASARWARAAARDVDLDSAPLKYAGLSLRRDLDQRGAGAHGARRAAREARRPARALRGEDVEATVLGEFTDTGRLEVFVRTARRVGDLDMEFLHDGMPQGRARGDAGRRRRAGAEAPLDPRPTSRPTLLALLAHPDVASKEWIIRQYDHEVQGGIGREAARRRARATGRATRPCVAPMLGSTRGVAIGVRHQPALRRPRSRTRWPRPRSTRRCATSSRVGGDPDRTRDPRQLLLGQHATSPTGSARSSCARAGCRDAALALRHAVHLGQGLAQQRVPTDGGRRSRSRTTLLVTALAIVPDVAQRVTMDLKARGQPPRARRRDRRRARRARPSRSPRGPARRRPAAAERRARAQDLPRAARGDARGRDPLLPRPLGRRAPRRGGRDGARGRRRREDRPPARAGRTAAR